MRPDDIAQQPWLYLSSMPDSQEADVAILRRWACSGDISFNRLMALLLQYNSRVQGGEVFLEEGKRIIQEYSQACFKSGFTLAEAVCIFLFFRRSILGAIYETGYLGGSDDDEGQRLFRRTNDFLDSLLVNLIRSFAERQLETRIE